MFERTQVREFLRRVVTEVVELTLAGRGPEPRRALRRPSDHEVPWYVKETWE
jgi:hypothetical protein